ncbi:outer membrane protein assembly factor BamB [Aquincola tertiaricarbonis]|uniref:Outer membrane protein assembly factor BamB n=1 Tax=Aquincola tertiaricarbonis TaxID=391953 RepID=A0ABY4S9X2_AQUTE|nr:outer membrane protein assembly factor BamB [Aquincola tertiaricarbonis]URI08697.1 outer membrane protein assembly factor BamB [Aquincola tertiaricarbonis]
MDKRSSLLRFGALALVAALAAGCSSTDKPKPTALESYTPQIAGRQVWSVRLDKLDFPLVPTVREGEITLASGNGTVVALQADTGAELWRGNVGAPIVAGVGTDGRMAAVVTRDNELVVLERGAPKWRTRLNARVATPPLVAGERVFVMGVDRIVNAFDALDGKPLWRFQRPGDALTLSQASVLSAFKDTLLVGQGPRLVGLDPLRGSTRWDVAVATPRGTNEVERLADVIGPPVRLGDTVCMRAFQSAAGCVNAERGTLQWSKNVGGVQAVGGDDELVVGADASDRITAWRSANGDVAWTSERLLYRQLSGALVVGRTVIFGDAEGQVHFLDRANGNTLLRLPTDGSAVVGAPVRWGNTVIVTTRNGGVFAFRPE